MVKKFGVAGKHGATRWTGYKPLLSVATHVFSQTIPDLEESITACNTYIETLFTWLKKERTCFKMCLLSRTTPLAEEGLLLVCKGLLLSTLHMIVHMTVEPLRIVKWTLHEGGHMWSPKWCCLHPHDDINIRRENTLVHHSAPTGKQIFLILREKGCCCAILGCSWANQGGIWAAVSQWTWVSRDSCGSRHGPPILQDYPWTGTHSPSRDKRTHLNDHRGEEAYSIKDEKKKLH